MLHSNVNLPTFNLIEKKNTQKLDAFIIKFVKNKFPHETNEILKQHCFDTGLIMNLYNFIIGSQNARKTLAPFPGMNSIVQMLL